MTVYMSRTSFKGRLAAIAQNFFIHKKRTSYRYNYLVVCREEPYFLKERSDWNSKYNEEDIIKILEFDNVFVIVTGQVFNQEVCIPMGTNCALFLADIFLYLYEAEFIPNLFWAVKKQLLILTLLTNTSMKYCPLIIQDLRVSQSDVHCISLRLRSKKRHRATLLLPTWICSYWMRGTVNTALPFTTTNLTISISVTQTFRAWLVIYHIRLLVAFLP